MEVRCQRLAESLEQLPNPKTIYPHAASIRGMCLAINKLISQKKQNCRHCRRSLHRHGRQIVPLRSAAGGDHRLIFN